MRNKPQISIFSFILDPWVIIGGGIVTVILFFGVGLLYSLYLPDSNSVFPTAVIQVIPAPTSTQSIQTNTPDPNDVFSEETESIPGKNITLGAYVQIQGTEGDGLRIRKSPGLESTIEFVALESEVFQVEEGPIAESGYTWWYLIAPYDDSIHGWAVDTYLALVQNP